MRSGRATEWPASLAFRAQSSGAPFESSRSACCDSRLFADHTSPASGGTHGDFRVAASGGEPRAARTLLPSVACRERASHVASTSSGDRYVLILQCRPQPPLL